MTRVRGDLRAVVWQYKQNVNMLTDLHHPPAEGNFCDEQGNALKPIIIQDNNRHMGYIDRSGHMTDSQRSGQKVVLSPSVHFSSDQ
jgi:hypothetical protein